MPVRLSSRVRPPLRLVTVRPRSARAVLIAGTRLIVCAIGTAGIVRRKREGDLATPIGRWPVRAMFYRPERAVRPACALAVAALTRRDGWCDAPAVRAYNRPVATPFAASYETLWRDDALYDLGFVLGHNDRPVVRGAGSAIFLHLAGPGLAPTEGCIALARRDFARIAAAIRPGRDIVVGPAPVRPSSASGHKVRRRRRGRG